MELTIEQQRALALARARQRAAQQVQPSPGPSQASAPGSGMVAGDIIGQMAGGAASVPSASPQVSQAAQTMSAASEFDAMGNAQAFRQGVAENIPIVGPLATNAADFVGSNIAGAMTGGDPSQIREQAVGQFEEQMAPYGAARTAGAVTGAVGPLAALGTTQAGGQMLGLTGSLPQRAMAGATSGAAIAAGDTAARGGSLQDTLAMGGAGLGLGAVAPLAERPMSALLRAMIGQRGASPAVNTFGRSLERDQIPPDQVVQRLDDIGPGAMPVDLGTNTMRQGGAIASLPGEGATTLRNALIERQSQTNPRIQAQINDILGEAPVPSRLQTGIRENQQALSPEYQEVLRGANAVDTSDLALTLESLAVSRRGDAQRAAQNIRKMLNIPGTSELDRSPATLLQTRNAIDGLFDGVSDNNVIGVLTDARREVDNLLTGAVPGIKDVDARFQELARQNEAITTGQQLLDSGRTAIRPQELDDLMMQQGVIMGPTGAPFRLRQGTRAEIDRIVGTTGNNLTGLKSALKGDGSWNRDRLVSLYGQDRADELLGVLEREMRFNRSYNVVAENSESAARLAAQQEVSPTQFGRESTTLVDVLMRIPQGLANMGARARSESTNAQLAQLLSQRPTPDLVEALSARLAQSRGVIPPASAGLLLSGQNGG